MLLQFRDDCAPPKMLVKQELALAMAVRFRLVVDVDTLLKIHVSKVVHADRPGFQRQQTFAVRAAQKVLIGQFSQSIGWHIANRHSLARIDSYGDQGCFAHAKSSLLHQHAFSA